MDITGFKKNSAAVTAALIASVLLLASACILPEIVIEKLCARVGSELDLAIDNAISGDYASAYSRAAFVNESIERKADLLKLFFDHNEIYALMAASKSAEEIAQTEDAAQLLEELNDVLKLLEGMRRMNDASIYNLF